jgi:hypothetical protein
MKINIKQRKNKKENQPEMLIDEETGDVNEMSEREKLISLRKSRNEIVEDDNTEEVKGIKPKFSVNNIGRDYKKIALYSAYSAVTLAAVFVIAFLSIKIIDYKKFIPIDSSIKKIELSSTAASSGNSNFSLAPEVPILRDQENPVNGVMVTKAEMDKMKSRKLVVVSINNHSKARPQFGLSKADLVLEVLAEGGITRYNAFYYQDQTVKKVGPIRSARSYMLYFFSGFDDPVFVHEGQASYPRQEKAIPEINTLQQFSLWKIKTMQTAGSRYRDPARIKSAGYVHSLMTGFDLINKEVDRLKWRQPSNITPLKFKYDETLENRGTAKKIEVKFSSIGGNAYKNAFDYDAESNSYLRSIGGKADTDALTGERISPKNVIVEYHNYRDAMVK